MDGTNSLPNDLTECHQLLAAAYRQSVQLEQQAEKARQGAEQAQRRVAESDQQAAELNRVLDETAASFETLKQEHAAALDELTWYKRWAFGRRRERFTEGQGQGHLFDLDPPAVDEPEDSKTSAEESAAEVKGHRRRKRRKIDWDKLPQVQHEHDLSEEEKICPCGRTKNRIGEDITRELEYVPPKLTAHIHTRFKYACCLCKDGVSAAPLPPRTIPGGIAGPGLITEVFVGKFGDHLPLHRLEDILARYGVYISRSTMSGWMKAVHPTGRIDAYHFQ
jgi:transposase